MGRDMKPSLWCPCRLTGCSCVRNTSLLSCRPPYHSIPFFFEVSTDSHPSPSQAASWHDIAACSTPFVLTHTHTNTHTHTHMTAHQSSSTITKPNWDAEVRPLDAALRLQEELGQSTRPLKQSIVYGEFLTKKASRTGWASLPPLLFQASLVGRRSIR